MEQKFNSEENILNENDLSQINGGLKPDQEIEGSKLRSDVASPLLEPVIVATKRS